LTVEEQPAAREALPAFRVPIGPQAPALG